ncbi:MAG: hypothetical protein QM500_12195 [Methylococcales bacterium]
MDFYVKTFENDGTTFGAKYAAEAWLTENGYSYGSSDCMGPQGIVKGAGVYISKWRNMSSSEHKAMDGALRSGRDCDAVITLKQPPISIAQ